LVDVTLSLLTPFAAWIPAEACGVSGVLAVVVAGLYVGRAYVSQLPAATRLQDLAFWRVLTFLLEGLLFILVGLELRTAVASVADHPPLALARYAALMSLTVILLRIAWVFAAAYLPPLLVRLRQPAHRLPDWRDVAVVAWMGMRGGDSLATALALPLATSAGVPFRGRGLIIFLAFAVIVATLVFQGLTLAPLISWLGVQGDEGEREERLAWQRMTRAGLRRLDALAGEPWVPHDFAARLRARLAHRAGDLAGDADPRHLAAHAAARRLERAVLSAQRQEAISLRDGGVINDDVLHRVERDLDLEEVQLEAEE
jgi:CPA1 family monovalent cation:H+ antiporter